MKNKKLIALIAGIVVLIGATVFALTNGDMLGNMFKGMTIRQLMQPRNNVVVYVKDMHKNPVSGTPVWYFVIDEATQKYSESVEKTNANGAVAFNLPPASAEVAFSVAVTCSIKEGNICSIQYRYYDATTKKIYMNKGSTALAPTPVMIVPVQTEPQSATVTPPAVNAPSTTIVKVLKEDGSAVPNAKVSMYTSSGYEKGILSTEKNGIAEFAVKPQELSNYYFIASGSGIEYGRTSCDKQEAPTSSPVILKPSSVACIMVYVQGPTGPSGVISEVNDADVTVYDYTTKASIGSQKTINGSATFAIPFETPFFVTAAKDDKKYGPTPCEDEYYTISRSYNTIYKNGKSTNKDTITLKPPTNKCVTVEVKDDNDKPVKDVFINVAKSDPKKTTQIAVEGSWTNSNGLAYIDLTGYWTSASEWLINPDNKQYGQAPCEEPVHYTFKGDGTDDVITFRPPTIKCLKVSFGKPGYFATMVPVSTTEYTGDPNKDFIFDVLASKTKQTDVNGNAYFDISQLPPSTLFKMNGFFKNPDELMWYWDADDDQVYILKNVEYYKNYLNSDDYSANIFGARACEQILYKKIDEQTVRLYKYVQDKLEDIADNNTTIEFGHPVIKANCKP